MNPLYNQFQNPNSGNSLMQMYQQFRQSFQGNPQQQIQQLLNSGKVNQAQYNKAVQMAQQFQRMFNIK